MKQCPICDEMTGKLPTHLKWCKKKQDFLIKYSMTKEKMEYEYRELGSVLEFKKKYPHWKGNKQYYELFKQMGVDVSVKAAANHPKVKKKKKTTSLDRYGYSHNFQKGHPSRKMWEERLLKEEGITNVFQRESVKQKSAKTLAEKYGEDYKSELLTQSFKGRKVISNLNRKIFELLEELNVQFTHEFPVYVEGSRRYLYIYDVKIIDTNKIIEVNGDYWHCNPDIYKPSDLVLKGSNRGEYSCEEKWERDRVKLEFAKKRGYDVLVIWEKDMKENIEQVKLKIQKWISE